MVDVLFKISIIITFASPVLLCTTLWKAKQISMSRNPQMSFEWPEMCLQYRGCCLIVFSYRLIRLISWKSCSTSICKTKFPRLWSVENMRKLTFLDFWVTEDNKIPNIPCIINRNLEECCSCEEVNILVLQIMLKNGHSRIRLTKQHIQNCLYSLTFLKRPSSWIHLHRSWIGCV